MDWTDALKYISDFDEIVRYLDEMDRFHDYRVGNIEHRDGKASIFIEEVIQEKSLQESTGKIWKCDFEGIKVFEIVCDSAMQFYIGEVHGGSEKGEVMFELTNGYIRIVAETVCLRVPSDMRTVN